MRVSYIRRYVSEFKVLENTSGESEFKFRKYIRRYVSEFKVLEKEANAAGTNISRCRRRVGHGHRILE